MVKELRPGFLNRRYRHPTGTRRIPGADAEWDTFDRTFRQGKKKLPGQLNSCPGNLRKNGETRRAIGTKRELPARMR